MCALGVVATPAFARKREKKPVIFGKFVASEFGKTISAASPVTAATKEGEVSAIALGPAEAEECERAPKASGKVVSEESETLFLAVTFKDCPVRGTFGRGANKVHVVDHITFTLGMEFHSNRSVGLGGTEESEVKLSKTAVPFRISKTSCTILIPPQTIPLKDVTKPTKEFESAEYTTFEEPVSGKKKLEMFPSGFQKKLIVGVELAKIVTYLAPNAGCETEAPTNTEPESPYKGDAEFSKGRIEAELEDITIKDGNLSFVPAT